MPAFVVPAMKVSTNSPNRANNLFLASLLVKAFLTNSGFSLTKILAICFAWSGVNCAPLLFPVNFFTYLEIKGNADAKLPLITISPNNDKSLASPTKVDPASSS